VESEKEERRASLLQAPEQAGVLMEGELEFFLVLLTAGVPPDLSAVGAFHPQPAMGIPVPCFEVCRNCQTDSSPVCCGKMDCVVVRMAGGGHKAQIPLPVPPCSSSLHLELPPAVSRATRGRSPSGYQTGGRAMTKQMSETLTLESTLCLPHTFSAWSLMLPR